MPVPRRAAVIDWLHEVSRTARAAAQAALRSRTAGRTVQIGASGSASAEFDVATELAIVNSLKDAPIPFNIVSEELGERHLGAEWSLVIDPVDGSRNAARGIPFYCVSIAVARKDLRGVEMGIVQNIPNGQVYFGERGHGATRDGRAIHPRRMDPAEVLVGAALDYEKGFRFPTRKKTHFRDFGSAALEMCFVADGQLDAFLCVQPYLRVIDIAASTLIVKEAGGRVWDLKKKPLNVPFLVRNRFAMIAVGDARVWRVLR